MLWLLIALPWSYSGRSPLWLRGWRWKTNRRCRDVAQLKYCVTVVGFSTTSLIEDSNTRFLWYQLLQAILIRVCIKTQGPSTIVFHFLVRFPFIPREGRSPGFCTPGQCLHKSCVVYSREFSLFLLSHIASMSWSRSNTRFSHHLQAVVKRY